jgi:PPK2 family polyphosphate:nucleotide phosphotransferase
MYKVTGEQGFKLSNFDTKPTEKMKKSELVDTLEANKEAMRVLQSKLYADGKAGLLVVFQGMDGAGKDGAIRHVVGVNPQGVNVYSFKQPSRQELAHDYLWRVMPCMPERGMISVFNRSYYEDVLVVKVHQLYKNLNILERCKGEDTIKKRYKHISNMEEYLWDNGIITAKIFLHLSKDEQKRRFLERIDREDKNWKFTSSDLKEREYWKNYQDAFESAIAHTSTKHNPWWVVPADNKAYARVVTSQILLDAMEGINPKYPVVSEQHKEMLKESRIQLTK